MPLNPDFMSELAGDSIEQLESDIENDEDSKTINRTYSNKEGDPKLEW